MFVDECAGQAGAPSGSDHAHYSQKGEHACNVILVRDVKASLMVTRINTANAVAQWFVSGSVRDDVI